MLNSSRGCNSLVLDATAQWIHHTDCWIVETCIQFCGHF